VELVVQVLGGQGGASSSRVRRGTAFKYVRPAGPMHHRVPSDEAARCRNSPGSVTGVHPSGGSRRLGGRRREDRVRLTGRTAPSRRRTAMNVSGVGATPPAPQPPPVSPVVPPARPEEPGTR